MAERIKNSGFWTFRFLVTPEEFCAWIADVTKSMNISPDDGAQDCAKTAELLNADYRIFYDGLVSPDAEERRSPFIRVWLSKAGFNTTIHLQKKSWYFDPPGGTRVSRDFFLELVSPKGYAVDDPDGKHYDYYDIHEKEPSAKKVFDELASPIKKITRPLYSNRFGKPAPEYQIRVSEQAWTGLVASAFMRGPGQALSAKWQAAQ
jgi:hypothetical protein